MRAGNTIKSFGNTRWRTDDIFSIPGGGSKGDAPTDEELKIMRQNYPLWSKNLSPLVNPVLGNQLKIKPNRREQLLAQTSSSLDGTVWGGKKLGHINKTQAIKMVENPGRFGLDAPAVMRLAENLGIQV